MPFDPKTSKIAITIPQFKLLANADSIFDRYSEPYIVSLAVDEADTKALELEFNLMPFPKVRKGATVRSDGPPPASASLHTRGRREVLVKETLSVPSVSPW